MVQEISAILSYMKCRVGSVEKLSIRYKPLNIEMSSYLQVVTLFSDSRQPQQIRLSISLFKATKV